VRRILAEDKENHISVTAAYDPDPDSQETARKDFEPRCRICSSEEDLVDDPEITWVFIDSLPVKVASFGGRNFFTPDSAGQVERIGPNENGDPAYSGWPDPRRCSPFDGVSDIFDNQVVILDSGFQRPADLLSVQLEKSVV